MSKVSYPGFMFVHSGVLNHTQIKNILDYCATEMNIPCDFYINVVENREGKKFGHSYIWTNSIQMFNVLIGKNLDGSDRTIEKEDDSWEPPSIPLSEALKEAKGNWGLEAEIEDRYECPMITEDLEPLIILPGAEYTQEQRTLLDTDDECGFIEIYPARVTIRSDNNKINSIYSSNIPDWVTPEIMYNFFAKFCSDTVSKNKNKETYPLIKISKRQKRNVQITFSQTDRYLSYFIMNIARKVKFFNTKTKEEHMLFFSHSKQHN